VGGGANEAIRVLNFETENCDMGKAVSISVPGAAGIRRMVNARVGSDVDIRGIATGKSYRIDRNRINRYIR
jgi:hypothetical protein